MTRFAECIDPRDVTDYPDAVAEEFLEPIGRHAPLGLPCQVHDAELWFAEKPADLERAKALCADCPVRAACFAGALERREAAGVWGGQIFQDGRVIPFKRARGRPRKNEQLLTPSPEAGLRHAFAHYSGPLSRTH